MWDISESWFEINTVSKNTISKKDLSIAHFFHVEQVYWNGSWGGGKRGRRERKRQVEKEKSRGSHEHEEKREGNGRERTKREEGESKRALRM